MNNLVWQRTVLAGVLAAGLGWALLSRGQAEKAVPTTDDPKAWAELTPDQIAQSFSLDRHMKNVDRIFERVGLG